MIDFHGGPSCNSPKNVCGVREKKKRINKKKKEDGRVEAEDWGCERESVCAGMQAGKQVEKMARAHGELELGKLGSWVGVRQIRLIDAE